MLRMIKIEGVRGSEAQAKPLVVGKDTVYVHTNIEHITGAEIDEYQYDELQYDKDEYIEMISQSLEETQEAVDYLLMGGE